MDVEHISVGGIVYDVSDAEARARVATEENYGNVKLSGANTYTELAGTALPTREKNPEVEGTIMWELEQLRQREEFFRRSAVINTVPGGRDLTNVYSVDEICRRIADGSFDDLYVGDYFDITMHSQYTDREEVRCMLAAPNIYLWNGDVPLTRQHMGIIPRNCFTKLHQMNPTNSTAGGYTGSKMSTEVLTNYAQSLKQVFGDHMLVWRDLLTTDINPDAVSMSGYGRKGASSDWTWTSVSLVLLSEPQVYGCTVYGSSALDVGIAKNQLPLFRMFPELTTCRYGGTDGFSALSRASWWLKPVSDATAFVVHNSSGNTRADFSAYPLGVRPLFLIG